jgi:hypothetical protein
MERFKFIYLTGLVATIISLSCLLLWLFTKSTLIASMGFGLSFLTAFMVILGIYHAYIYYNDKKFSKNTLKERRKHFLAHTLVLSLGLAFSWVNFTTLKNYALPSENEKITLTVSNTSDKPVENVKFRLGSQKYTIDKLDKRKSQIFELNPVGEAIFYTELVEDNLKREASISIGSDNHEILLRIDYQHNLLPEVQ